MSTIPGAGRGVFANINFKEGDLITGYAGIDIPVSADYAGGTHVLKLRNGLVRDGNPANLRQTNAQIMESMGAVHIERKGLGQFCNSKRGANNAAIRVSWKGGVANVAIRATKNIRAGEEVFVPYGWSVAPDRQTGRPPAPPALPVRESSLASLSDPPTPRPPSRGDELSSVPELSENDQPSQASTPATPPLFPPPAAPPAVPNNPAPSRTPTPPGPPPPPPQPDRKSSGETTESDDLEPYHPKVAGLINVSNSCYMDSTLMALFANRNRVIEEYILHADVASLGRKGACQGLSQQDDFAAREALRMTLDNVNDRMHDMTDRTRFTCENLRGAIRACLVAPPAKKGLRRSTRSNAARAAGPADFSSGHTQDPEEFLRFLLEKFAVERNLQVEQSLMSEVRDEKAAESLDEAEWEKQSENRSRLTVVKLDLESDFVLRPSYALQVEYIEPVPSGYKQPAGKAYRWRKFSRVVHPGDYLVISANRALPRNRIDKTPVDVEETIGPLHLHAVVCYRPGHYVCFLKLRGQWVLYDDMRRGFTEIGSFDQMLAAKPSPSTSGCQFYYSRPGDNQN